MEIVRRNPPRQVEPLPIQDSIRSRTGSFRSPLDPPTRYMRGLVSTMCVLIPLGFSKVVADQDAAASAGQVLKFLVVVSPLITAPVIVIEGLRLGLATKVVRPLLCFYASMAVLAAYVGSFRGAAAAIGFVVSLAFFAGYTKRYGARVTLESMRVACVFLCLLVITDYFFHVWYSPREPISLLGIKRLSGAGIGPNGVAEIAGCLTVISFGLRNRKGLVFGLACLLLADSRTTNLAILMAFGVHAVRQVTHRNMRLILNCAGVGVFLILTMTSVGSSLFGSVQSAGIAQREFEVSAGRNTLEQRIDIWRSAKPLILAKPVLGHGYLSSRELLPPLNPTWSVKITHAHNLVVQWALEGGIVGIGFALVVLSGVRRIRHPLGIVFVVTAMLESVTGVSVPGLLLVAITVLSSDGATDVISATKSATGSQV
jgi:hypothetical protein